MNFLTKLFRSAGTSERARGASPSRGEAGEPKPRPEPARGLNNYIIVVLDSLRFDALVAAAPKTLLELGELQRRWSYASWTAPSHYNLLMGLLPHPSPQGVFASEYYKGEFVKYNERLGTTGIEFKRFVPDLFLPSFLRNNLGYRTHAKVSLPVLNPRTAINKDFDTFKLMPKHNDMAAMVDELSFDDRPSFCLLNVGETHYPYALPHEPKEEWPHISGVHGVFKHLDDHVVDGDVQPGEDAFFDQRQLDRLKEKQIEAVRYLDSVFEELFDVVPRNTYITVLADHGECFGEDGYFGHGPVQHDKVLEVPLIEGMVP